jgi:predicted Zn-dependent peptidase
MIVSIVGDIQEWKQETEKWFVMPKKKTLIRKKTPLSLLRQNISNTEKRKVANTYVVVGFKTVPQGHKDSYVLEVINGILGRGQSGKMFTEIRSKRGLAYDVGTQHVAEVSFGYFAVYATVDKKNIALVKKVILEEMKKIKFLHEEDLKEAKDFIEGDYLLDLEDVQKISDQLLFWEQLGKSQLMDKYISEIKKVTLSDIERVLNTYFKHHALVVLEGK